ncbi:uncharacterized protein LOC129738246 [Uranotaenia lowii]|uniref:uncharacterized protein LOC129738246 n=1 Tax=Uranotaenia lowii TaxID=190385 RepID=UPI0024797656|nr:uncharacterized protein LOC129738246 [Uranotaenia lowii]
MRRELAKEKAHSKNLAKELDRANETIKCLQVRLGWQKSHTPETGVEEYEEEVELPSAQRNNNIANIESRVSIFQPTRSSQLEESRFVASLNQMSIASIAIPECKPLENSSVIERQAFNNWKDLLVDSLKLAGINDEQVKFTVFKVKAGSRLLEIYRNIHSSPGAPDFEIYPFTNAMYRLSTHFSSDTDVMMQRRKLAMIQQNPEESDLNFVMRLGSLARLCNYDGDKEFSEIINVIAGSAKNKDVRKMAMKMMSCKGTFSQVVDKVKEIETIRMNEEFFQQKLPPKEPAMLARVDYTGSSERGAPKRPWSQGNSRFDSGVMNPWKEAQNRYSSAGGMRNRFQNNRSTTGSSSPWKNSPNAKALSTRGGFGNRSSSLRGGSGTNENKCVHCHSVFHKSSDCFAKEYQCKNCDEFGHIIRACPHPPMKRRRMEQRFKGPSASISAVEKSEDSSEIENMQGHHCYKTFDWMIASIEIKPKDGLIEAKIAGMKFSFLIDSGAQVNTVTKTMFNVLWENLEARNQLLNIQKSDRPLKAYATAKEIEVLLTFEAPLFISIDRPIYIEKFFVVQANQPLLSRATSQRYSILLLGLDVPVKESNNRSTREFGAGEISHINVKKEFAKFNIPPVSIDYDRSKVPCRNVFMNIPVSLKPLVEKRLKELISASIIEPVTSEMDNSFCSSMIVVPKGKHDIRLVIDLRGPNRYIKRTPFAMPTLEKILSDLDGATWFSTIDLSNAFFHIVLEEGSRHLTNFYTEFGMFRFVRLPFGLTNAPDIFQETLQCKILEGCEGTKNYQDDILVYGRTKTEHDERLQKVKSRLANHNVEVNTSKCVFGSQSVKFLGFTLTSEGWAVEAEKVDAIRNFRRPVSCSEVKSFLGLITFADRFIIHRATFTEKLRALANSPSFYWTESEQQEFDYLKNDALKTIQKLGYYSKTDKIELFVDASGIGLGAVLVQYNSEGNARIIACASKALTPTEQKYPQTHREALAVVWGVERFNYHLMGRSFVVRTDAQANEFIYNGLHRIGKRATSRAEAWALRLQSYDFKIMGVSGHSNVADALSRLIQNTEKAIPFEEEEANHLLFALEAGVMDLTLQEIETETENDDELQLLKNNLRNNNWSIELKKYAAHKKNINNLGSLLYKDDRIILPKSLHNAALLSSHGGHIGETAMKRIMREFFWWPGMAKDTENFVKNCKTCVMMSKRNPPIPLYSRDLPEGPWEILQVDFLAVPGFGSGEFLVLLDTYSRYLTVVEMHRTDADSTNAALCNIFKLWGCPKLLQSDNGPPFQSATFCEFWEEKAVKIKKSIPLCPRTNGAVERQNQGIIKALTAAKIDGVNWRTALQKYIHHHNTLVPHARLNVTPFELLVGWKYRGTFPALWSPKIKTLDRIDIAERDKETKYMDKTYANINRGAKESTIKVGDKVLLFQSKKSKSDPSFSSEYFSVVAREGGKVVIISQNGVQYTRNIEDIKKYDPENILIPGEAEQPTSRSPADEANQQKERFLPVSTRLRERKNLKRPARYDDRDGIESNILGPRTSPDSNFGGPSWLAGDISLADLGASSPLVAGWPYVMILWLLDGPSGGAVAGGWPLDLAGPSALVTHLDP